MHVTEITRFDWSAVFENFWYKKLELEQSCVVFSASFWYKYLERVSHL